MNNKKHLKFAGIILSAVFAGSVFAEGVGSRYKLDSDSSQIGFYVKAKITNVRGRFLRFHTKTLNYTPGNIENLSGVILVDTASVFTRDRKRDEHLREDDFFYTEKYKTASAVLDKVTKAEGENAYNALITLNIRDKSKQYSVPVQITENDERLRVKGRFIVNRQTFDLTGEHIANIVMDDDVEVKFDVRFNAVEPQTEPEEEMQPVMQPSAIDDL